MTANRQLDRYREMLATAYADDMATVHGSNVQWGACYSKALTCTTDDLMRDMVRRAAIRKSHAVIAG